MKKASSLMLSAFFTLTIASFLVASNSYRNHVLSDTYNNQEILEEVVEVKEEEETSRLNGGKWDDPVYLEKSVYFKFFDILFQIL